MTDRRRLALLVLVGITADLTAFPRLTPQPNAPSDRVIVRLGSPRFRHPGRLQAVAFSPDGKLVAASSAEPAMVRVWDRATGDVRDEWHFNDPAAPEQLVFAPDSAKVIAGRFAGRSPPWVARDVSKHVATDLGPTADEQYSFQTLTPDGRHGILVTGERVLCWDLAIEKQVGSFDRPERRVANCSGPEFGWVMIAHDGSKYTATRLTDGKELWTVDGEWDGILPNQPAAFADDGRRVAIRVADGRVGIFDTLTGKSQGQVAGPEGAGVAAMRFAPDGKSLAVSWKDKAACAYDIGTGKELCRLPATCAHPRDLAFSPDSKTLATVDPDGPRSLLFFDAARGTALDGAGGHTSPVTAIAVSPDGSAVACATGPGGDPSLVVWDVATGRPRWTSSAARFVDVAFSADGKLLATASRGLGGHVILWEAGTGRRIRAISATGDTVSAVRFTRDGRLVTAGSTELQAYKLGDPEVATERTALPHSIDRFAIDSAGRRLIASTPGLYVCRPGVSRTDEPDVPLVKTLTGFALSPDGRLVATTDGSDTIRLWETLSHQEAAALRFPEPAAGVGFSPDGRTLAVAAGRGVVLFDLATASARFTLPVGKSPDTLVAFSADGRRLVTAGNRESSATVWDVADLGRRKQGRRLTAGELTECWAALADTDPKTGYAAAWMLAAAPADALPFLTRVLGKPGPAGKQVAQWIADLDSPRFAVREQASRELEGIGELIVDRLRDARKGKVSAEQGERLDALLARLAGARPSSDRLRASRAVDVLEHIGGHEVQSLLEELAKGPDTAPKTHEAQAAIERRK